MKILKYLIILILINSCVTVNLPQYSEIVVTPLFEKENIGIRALEIENDKVYFAGAKGWTGSWNITDSKLTTQQIDSTMEFRSMVVHNGKIMILNILSPAYLFKGNSVENLEPTLIDDHPDAFYNALEMNHKGFGVMLGDATENCLNIRITQDAGETWTRVPCEQLGAMIPGEAAFAASDTNISFPDKNTVVIGTGGAASRILMSKTKGELWKSFPTPIIQGKPTTGIYSLDFYDSKKGIAIGGDYTDPENNDRNLIKTNDGGVSWEILDHPSHPSYRSCVQFIPESSGKSVVAAGFQGIDISHNGGETWKKISDQSVYTFRFLNKNTAFAGGKNGFYKLDFH